MDNPQVLIQQEPRLSPNEATRILDDLLFRLNIKLPKNDKSKQYIVKGEGTENEIKIFCKDLLNQIRENGVSEIQIDLDRIDTVFGGTFSMATSSWQMTITTEWAGFKKELKGPCRDNSSELELSEDIEFYKSETCLESVDYDFEMCARNYRGYLFSSIALIDAYINRHIILHKYLGLKTDNFIDLQNCRHSEKRIELFINEFCNFKFYNFTKGKEWNDYKKLKELRNESVHALHPYFGISLKDVANTLNLSINGVGGLLKKLQEGQNRFTLGFIEKVRTSPIIHLNQTIVNADGKHFEKKHFNKINRI